MRSAQEELARPRRVFYPSRVEASGRCVWSAFTSSTSSIIGQADTGGAPGIFAAFQQRSNQAAEIPRRRTLYPARQEFLRPRQYGLSVRVWALVEVGDTEAIDLFVRQGDAQRALEDCLADEPDWAGRLQVEELELAGATEPAGSGLWT
jgi:hypothetical protein